MTQLFHIDPEDQSWSQVVFIILRPFCACRSNLGLPTLTTGYGRAALYNNDPWLNFRPLYENGR